MTNNFWLTSIIDKPQIEQFADALAEYREGYRDKPFNIQITNEGGDSEAAMAMYHLIKNDGNCDAYLVANASSAATLIFAACARRYVYPMTRLGFHVCYWDDVKMRLDASVLKALLEQFETTDMRSCEIYAAASNKPAEWWLNLLNRNSYGVFLDAAELVNIGMAEWVKEQAK